MATQSQLPYAINFILKKPVFILSGKLIKTIKWAFILYLLFSNEGGFPSL